MTTLAGNRGTPLAEDYSPYMSVPRLDLAGMVTSYQIDASPHKILMDVGRFPGRQQRRLHCGVCLLKKTLNVCVLLLDSAGAATFAQISFFLRGKRTTTHGLSWQTTAQTALS